MSRHLPADFVARYARPPSDTTVQRAISIHKSVRDLLGDSEYATLLQGSYKNDTALWDMNDIDIVAVSRSLMSSVFTGKTSTSHVQWTDIFARIEQKLQSDARYKGIWKREDKCIRLNTEVRIDIVPAVYIVDPSADPISIYSFSAACERRNWPRGHHDAGAAKSTRTSGVFKQTVRLFKRWVRCWFSSKKVAPSYYIECLLNAQPDGCFTGDLAQDFVTLGTRITQIQYGVASLPRLAGEGNILSVGEWEQSSFVEFQRTLLQAIRHAQSALGAYSEAAARSAWLAAFNGQQPS